jgi:hypothetical protein
MPGSCCACENALINVCTCSVAVACCSNLVIVTGSFNSSKQGRTSEKSLDALLALQDRLREAGPEGQPQGAREQWALQEEMMVQVYGAGRWATLKKDMAHCGKKHH